MSPTTWAILAANLLLAGCDEGRDVYTLYRNSVVLESARIHVATFNAKEGGDYNQANCFHAIELYQKQPDVRTRFWCEKGDFLK